MRLWGQISGLSDRLLWMPFWAEINTGQECRPQTEDTWQIQALPKPRSERIKEILLISFWIFSVIISLHRAPKAYALLNSPRWRTRFRKQRREKSKLTVAYFLEETNINVINMFPLNLSLSLVYTLPQVVLYIDFFMYIIWTGPL